MKTLSYIRYLLTTMLVASWLAACDNGGNDNDLIPVDNTYIVMRLTVSNSTDDMRSTRATPTDGEYNRGEGFENYIDIPNRNFRFYFFGADNKLVAPIEIRMIIPLESTATSKTYQVLCHGGGKDEYEGKQLKMVALANWPSYPAAESLKVGETTIDDIVKQQFDFSAESMNLSEKRTIPLYGVTNLTTIHYNSLNRADIGKLHLLRAYAKVEVILSEDCVFPIQSVAMTRYNSRGLCAPQAVYKQDDYVHNSWHTDYTDTPSLVAGCEVGEELSFIKVSEENTKPERWIAYVPEYKNVSGDASVGIPRKDDELARIKIKFEGKDYIKPEDEYDYLYFANYSSDVSPHQPDADGHFNILRNVWYKFTVNAQSRPIVQVVPYNEVDLEPVFGLLRDLDLVPIYGDDDQIWYYYDPNTGQYYGSDGKTPIKNPYLIDKIIHDGKELNVIRDLHDVVIGYWDSVENQYYDTNFNKVKHLNIDSSTGWRILYDVDDVLLGYYDPEQKLLYDDEKNTVPELHDPKNQTWIVQFNDNWEVSGYYDPVNNKRYDANRNPIN